jgi:NAD(P)-dependent dehydrogenase (short-subunit alcohol dehydrogenase family)
MTGVIVVNSILITGSNRGLGLEWVRQYAREGWRVFATCRFPEQASELQALATQSKHVTLHRLDVTRADELGMLRKELNDEPIDIVVNNAGVYHEQWGQDPLGHIHYENWQHTLVVNTLGPMRVSEALIENVARSGKKLIVSITSHMGSIADITNANDYAYRSSKAALNAAMKGLSFEARELGVGVLLLHPGWVCTRMGYDGEAMPW